MHSATLRKQFYQRVRRYANTDKGNGNSNWYWWSKARHSMNICDAQASSKRWAGNTLQSAGCCDGDCDQHATCMLPQTKCFNECYRQSARNMTLGGFSSLGLIILVAIRYWGATVFMAATMKGGSFNMSTVANYSKG